MKRFIRDVCIGALILLLTSALAWAQLSTAQLNGKVTDSSGGVLPGVTVTMTQTETGASRSTVTDETGSYVLSNLPTGPYRLEVTLQGFRTYVQTGIVLQVGATPTINAVMALGDLAETVTVEGATPLVDVQSAGIKDVVENERIVELPLQGRQVTDLIVLAGGAVNTGSPNSRNFGGVNIAVAGGLPFGVAYLLDGATHNDPQSNANLPLPFPDALQEFGVATSGLSAQNGMHSGAAVNAVTKSGTNNFHGNGFEFNRDHKFNATNPFALVGPDGKRKDDGLLRNQFGGTLGGPIVKGKLFFFGAYQGTATRQAPAANIEYVPTAAMMAGDFSTFASAACNGGRAVSLKAPFVNNQVNPALFSPAAVNLAKRLPATTDPCGQVTYQTTGKSDEGQAVGKVDFQLNARQTIFGRYMATSFSAPAGYAVDPTNVLTTNNPGTDNLAQSFTAGDTLVASSAMVNSLRVAFNRTAVHRFQAPFFSPSDLGINMYDYNPGEMVLAVTGGFNISAGTATKGLFHTNSYQLNDDLTMVRGRHQLAVGANIAYWKYRGESHARSGGNWTINGTAEGLGLADFLMGRVATMEQGGPGIIPVDQTYIGLYGQDTWRVTNRVTLNAGLRWEPYFGQNVEDGALSNFSMDNFTKGIVSSVYHNSPPGFLYPGDPGFAGSGTTGMNKQWWNLSPRGGLAWDVSGDGRMAIRASYGLAYDFPNADYHNINASSPPFGNRSLLQDPPGLMDNPYLTYGGNPHPILTNADTKFVSYGSFGVVDPNINSPRVQTWNVTVERQFLSVWQASASYLGSHSDRLWGQVAINPGQFLGTAPCVLNGVTYPVCTATSNLDQRRVLNNPLIGVLDLHTDVGTQNYRGLKLSARNRTVNGLSINGNYTVGRCLGNATPGSFPQLSSGFINPADPKFDIGHCTQDRTHIANVTLGAVTPELGNAVMRALASGWRASGILSASSGSWLNILTGQDNAGNGINAQRPNQVSDDVYGVKTLTNYLDKSAFAQPAPGTFGNVPFDSVKGPGQWKIDLSLSKNVAFSKSQVLELRLETFNLLNHFNWGNPNVTLSAGTFGKITSIQGTPRILQFGIKYAF